MLASFVKLLSSIGGLYEEYRDSANRYAGSIPAIAIVAARASCGRTYSLFTFKASGNAFTVIQAQAGGVPAVRGEKMQDIDVLKASLIEKAGQMAIALAKGKDLEVRRTRTGVTVSEVTKKLQK